MEHLHCWPRTRERLGNGGISLTGEFKSPSHCQWVCHLLLSFPCLQNINHSKKTGHQQTTPSMYRNYISYLTSWRHCSTCSWTNYKAAHSADPRSNMNSYATFPHICLFLQMIEVPLTQNLWKWFWNHISPCYRPVSTSTYFCLLLFFLIV